MWTGEFPVGWGGGGGSGERKTVLRGKILFRTRKKKILWDINDLFGFIFIESRSRAQIEDYDDLKLEIENFHIFLLQNYKIFLLSP
jgi:hypothetical protein